jgi:hypothetical protein
MKTTHPFFIGYGTLEEWLRSVDPKRPVFAALITEPGKVVQSMRTDRLMIRVAQPADDLMHYCQLVIARVQYVGDNPFNTDYKQRFSLAEQAWKVVEAWLDERGLTVMNGVVSMPDNLRLMDGWANFLVFDQQTQEFRRAEPGEEK